ncbi:MAG TPA: hypothetical protein VKG43_09495 [Acidimicrobiales bacterium]|nr:hypothetical protein [Acidimicrobiales bacterium]
MIGASTVHTGNLVLVVAVFLASAVEMVEALTIVLAVGATRGWRSALEGMVVAVVALAAIVAVFGPAIVHWVPISTLRIIVGGLLLYFGVGWLRKAILRASGRKAKHDEDAIYARTVAELSAEPERPGRDWTGFAVSFKGVFLEGIEVIIIVLTLGGAAHDIGLAALGALAAVLVVAVAGLVVARQLSGVPENAMKMTVGIMLVSFGTFWLGEGLGLHWPGSDLFVLALVAAYGAITWLLVTLLRRNRPAPAATTGELAA